MYVARSSICLRRWTTSRHGSCDKMDCDKPSGGPRLNCCGWALAHRRPAHRGNCTADPCFVNSRRSQFSQPLHVVVQSRDHPQQIVSRAAVSLSSRNTTAQEGSRLARSGQSSDQLTPSWGGFGAIPFHGVRLGGRSPDGGYLARQVPGVRCPVGRAATIAPFAGGGWRFQRVGAASK